MGRSLRQALQPTVSRLSANVLPRVPISGGHGRRKRTQIRLVRAVVLLALIQMGCEANRLAPHASASSAAKPTHSSLPAKLRQEPEPSLATAESELPPAKSMTWVREDEPTIEVTGPVPADPFVDWAPRAVLEKLPAPRAELVRLPQ